MLLFHPRSVHHRICHVGTTSSQLTAAAAQGERADADVERFFASFRFLTP